MWAISGENVGRIWDPHGTHMKKVDKNRMGSNGLLIWAPYGFHVGPRFCASWVHLKIVVKVKWGFVIIANHSYQGGGFRCSSTLCLFRFFFILVNFFIHVSEQDKQKKRNRRIDLFCAPLPLIVSTLKKYFLFFYTRQKCFCMFQTKTNKKRNRRFDLFCAPLPLIIPDSWHFGSSSNLCQLKTSRSLIFVQVGVPIWSSVKKGLFV